MKFVLGIVALALVLGYVCAVACYFLLTLLITTSFSNFVSSHGRFRSQYLMLSYILWTLCTLAGSYLTAKLSTVLLLVIGLESSSVPWLPVMALGVLLTLVTWFNPIEAKRQFAGLSRSLMSLFTIAGVAAGYFLETGI